MAANPRRARAALLPGTASAMPRGVRPMLAKPGKLPSGPGWAFEAKWDGIRSLAYCQRGTLRLASRNRNDVTHAYPELHGLARALRRDALLDGEVVATDAKGRPSFQLLQRRMGLASEREARRVMARVPVSYVAFDVLWLDGHLLTGVPYAERRGLLEQLALDSDHWRAPRHRVGEGRVMLDAAHRLGLEGVVAKRLGSAYEPGARSGDWVKVKLHRRQEFVIGGWTAGEGSRRGRLGAVLVGTYEHGALTYAGKVGTGYSDAVLRDLGGQLAPLRSARSPFAPAAPEQEFPGKASFVRPELVCEVEFTEWTDAGTLRHPSFKGLRPDKAPQEVHREDEPGREPRDEEQ